MENVVVLEVFESAASYIERRPFYKIFPFFKISDALFITKTLSLFKNTNMLGKIVFKPI
jgi:hypothetical protein